MPRRYIVSVVLPMHAIVGTLRKLRDRLWDHPVHWRAVLMRFGVGALALAAVVALGWLWGHHIPAVEAFIAGMGIWAPAIFMALFIVTMPLFVPNAPFAMAAGALFGVVWGSIYIVAAGLVAELIIFTAGHRFLRSRVEGMLAGHPKLMALKGALTTQPIRFMVLLRLSPLPFTPICYMLSTTRVSYRDYIIGFVGYIPGNVVTVYFGFVAKHMAKVMGGAETLSPFKVAIAGITLIATVWLVTYISHAAKRALSEYGASSAHGGMAGLPS